MQHSYHSEYAGVKIRQIEPRDLEKLRVWRNDNSNSRYLRQIGVISPEMQTSWYLKYLNDPSIISFAIEETKELKRLVGSVSIYDFDGTSSNCGKTMIGDINARGRNLGGRGEILALHVGFQTRGINNYHTEVAKENIASIKMTADFMGFSQIGMRVNSDGIVENLYYLTRDDFYKKHPYLLNVEIQEG